MKRVLLLGLCLLPLALSARQSFPFLHTVVTLDDSLDAATANRESDAYTAGLTPFDLSIRLNRGSGATETDYLELSARSMRDWPAAEAAQIKAGFESLAIEAEALELKLHLPDTIHICKTTGKEEFGAEGYTRHTRIMLNTAAGEVNPALLAHELWHVLSRLNPTMRNRAYAGFGFRPCNVIDYKPAFRGQVISNPDCPEIQHYQRIQKDGAPVDVAIVLYSRSPYVPGGGLMDYAAVGLLALQGDNTNKRPALVNGKPMVYEFAECPDFYRQTGRNSPYMLHIEEITAEHFAAMLTARKLKEQEFVRKLVNALRQ